MSTKPPDAPLPQWFYEGVFGPYRAGVASTFLVDGDVTGLVPNPSSKEPDRPYLTLDEFWRSCFLNRKMVIFYNVASGLRFLRPEMATVFRRTIGWSDGAAASGNDPIAAAKAQLQAKRSLPTEPEECLAMIELAMQRLRGVAVIIQSVDMLAPEGVGVMPLRERVHIERLRSWANDPELRNQGSIVVLLAHEAARVAMELRQAASGIPVVHIPRPTMSERRTYITKLAADGKYAGGRATSTP